MKKHIKFEENIKQDSSYNIAEQKRDASLAQKIAENSQDDNIDFTETKKWYNELPEEPISTAAMNHELLNNLKKEANSILHGESLAYETKMNRNGSSDQKWARSLLSKGAMADRVAAATILIQDNPIFNLNILRNLVSMVKPAKKKDSLTVIETLSELFLFDLLLPNAKLRKFESRPISELDKMSSGNRDHKRKILTYWIFEDQLKEIYGEFIKALNTFAHDTIEAHKEKAISAMSKLLMHNPEFEKVLLCSIVNKLGDPSQKVASKVIYHLCQVLYNHPNMKDVVLDEIEKMLFRPNISPKAQYYGVCFLNQFYLSKDDNKVAENLVRVYFSFFKACIKKGDIDTRLMSAILTGVKRCQPFLDAQKIEEIHNQANALHRLVHLARYNVAIHALALLLQISPLATQLSDRYYCALYKKLTDPETLTTTLPALLMNLIYRSIKVDENKSRIIAFLKRLLQLACMSDAPRACAFLLLIGRLARNKKLPLQWIVNASDEENIEVKEEEMKLESSNIESENTEMDSENVNNDTNIEKSKKKKNKNKSEAIAENNTAVNGVAKALWTGDKVELLNDDDEVYHDVILEEDEAEHKKKYGKILKNKKTMPSWVHSSIVNVDDANEKTDEVTKDEPVESKTDEKDRELKILIKKTKNMEKINTVYTPYNRNPAYCGAEHSVICELLPLLNHYHPTVRIFADKIVKRAFMQYSGDPLKDFSIARFLDRFAFKNPKKDVKPDDSEEQNSQPKHIKGSHPKFAQRKNYLPAGLKSLPVISAAYLNEDSAHIPADEKYLYDYLQIRKLKKEEEDGNESDAGSVGSEEFERYLENLGGKTNKGDESDEDLDFVKEMMANTADGKSKKEPDSEDDAVSDDEINSDMDDIEDDSDLEFSNEDDDDDDEHVNSKSSKKMNKNAQESESDLEFSDGGDVGDDDDIDIDDDDDDEDGFDIPETTEKKKKGKNFLKGDVKSMFASAEEFSTLLEDTGAVKGHGTSQAVANTENAHAKQLNWESNRDRWVKGYNKRDKWTKGESNKSGGKKFTGVAANKGNKRKFIEKGNNKGGKRPRK